MKFLKLIKELDSFSNTESFDAPTSRRGMFDTLRSGAVTAAKVGIPFGAALFAPKATYAQSGNSVIDVLNFALTLEYLEAEYYQTGLDTSGLLSGETRQVIELIGQHESDHVDFLRSAISGAGGTPVESPTFDFTAGGTFADVFSNPQTFLAVAQAFEDTGVRAYKGQAANLMSSPDVLTAALQIHSVEARHASEIRRIRGLQGWIPFDNGISVTAAEAVYAGEDNVTQLGLSALDVTNVTAEQVTEAYDEPLTQQAVLDIANLFIA